MLDATARKLVELLNDKQPFEVREAAVTVLAELGNSDSKIAERLCALLQGEDRNLRRPVLQAIDRLQIAQALPRLIEFVRAGGEDAPLAAQAAARMGAKGAKALQDLLSQVTPGQRPYIAAALGSAGNTRAEAAALEFLRSTEASVVDATVRSLIAQVPSFSPAHRRTLIEQLLALVDDRKNPLPPGSQGGALRLLAALGAPADLFWKRLQPDQPLEIRALAVQALGKLMGTPSREQLRLLFAAARDREFRVAGPALFIIQNIAVDKNTLGDWRALLEAPDLAARRLALDKLKITDTANVARALLGNLNHPDRGFRDEVLAALRQLDQGRKLLTQALLEAGGVEEAWRLARALGGVELSTKIRTQLLDQLCTFLEEGDRRAEPILSLFRDGPGTDSLKERLLKERLLKERLLERAQHWRKKKLYDKALVFHQHLTRDPACGFSVRLEAALCGLKVSAKDLAAEARAAEARAHDAFLAQFETLALVDEAELLKNLEKTKWLEPEDLFYLGFHLAEKEGRAKKVGGAVLKLLGKRSPKSKLAQAAKTKLRSSGLS